MDTITWEEAREAIVALGLPPVVLTAFDQKRVPAVLERQMRGPDELFVEPTAHEVYPPGRIVPLFADHTGHIVTAYRQSGGAPGFLRFLLEEPEAGAFDEGLSWQQAIVHVLLSVWEGRVDDDLRGAHDAVREAGALLGCDHVEALIAAFNAPRRVEDFDAWRADLLASLPAHVHTR